MKEIRYLATGLLLLTGVLHFIPLITNFSGEHSLPMAAFGIVYLGVAYLLYKNRAIGKFLGVLMPLVGMGAAVIQIGIPNWDLLLKVMVGIDVVVVVCCILLLNKRR
ncbi:MAG: hypothetical protein ACI8V8_001737 [Chitinophagales bacterium]|jgi:hypothetical protein